MNYLKSICQNGFLIVAFLLASLAGYAQNDARIHGKIVVVSQVNNTLIVKLQVKAIHNTDPGKTLRITSASFWFKYSDAVVALAEQPVAATSAALTDGDYYYPTLANPYYTEKVVTRETKNATNKFCFPHFVWEGWQMDPVTGYPVLVPPVTGDVVPISLAEPINDWTDIAVVKFNVLQAGAVNLQWDLVELEEEILDDLSYAYEIGQFDDLATTVTYQSSLQLASKGLGTETDPYKVTVRSTNSSQYKAGTAGFYVYYRSKDASAATTTDRLTATPYFWGAATILDEPIATISKDTVQYDRRISYVSNDGTQADDIWPVLAAAAREALHVAFTPTTFGTTNGIKTYLEPINASSFKTWDESETHTIEVQNAFRLLGGPGGGTPDPLPVSLTEFSATLQKQGTVLLHWGTASERNNDRFEVERSADGRSFTAISSVKGQGTTNQFHAYSTLDKDPLAGISYYRLKQIDTDGAFAYSQVVSVNRKAGEKAGQAVLFPNPTHGNAAVMFESPEPEVVSLTLFDALGKIIDQQTMPVNPGRNVVPVLTKGLPAGLYFLKVNGMHIQADLKIQKLND